LTAGALLPYGLGAWVGNGFLGARDALSSSEVLRRCFVDVFGVVGRAGFFGFSGFSQFSREFVRYDTRQKTQSAGGSRLNIQRAFKQVNQPECDMELGATFL